MYAITTVFTSYLSYLPPAGDPQVERGWMDTNTVQQPLRLTAASYPHIKQAQFTESLLR